MTTVKNFAEALSILIQVAHLAQSKGILTLNDAALVNESLNFIQAIQDEHNQSTTEQQTDQQTDIIETTL